LSLKAPGREDDVLREFGGRFGHGHVLLLLVN
jgi:hypothetical protein